MEEKNQTYLQTTKKVTFSEEQQIIYEPEDLESDLRESRISDFNQKQADHERYKRLLEPILSPKHRETVFSKYFCCKTK